jgi:protein transport protein SEC61 subunit gamma-like protein
MHVFDIAGFLRQSVRVMNVATRPRQKEFDKIVKITGIGMILVGLSGVLLSFVVNLV